MTSIVALSWEFKSFFSEITREKVKQFCHCYCRSRFCFEWKCGKPVTCLQLSMRDCCVIWHLGLVTIIFTYVVSIILQGVWSFEVWVFEVWSFEVWVFEVWSFEVWVFETPILYLTHAYNIWSIIIQSVFIDNHPTNTFNPQTWNKLNSKHLRISVDYWQWYAQFFFSIQIKAELSHILGKPKPVKEIAKFTAKLDQKDTCVYKHGQKH